jgi:hypothetical protein
LVFSERDNYQSVSTGSSAASSDIVEYLARRMTQGSFLFVGTTLRDPDVIQALEAASIRTKAGWSRDRWPWLVSPLPDDLPVVSTALRALDPPASRGFAGAAGSIVENAHRARLDHLQVRVIRPDHYGQVSQFVHELALGIVNPALYDDETKYSLRLKDWERFWRRSWARRMAAHAVGHGAVNALLEMSTEMRDLVDEFFRMPGFESVDHRNRLHQ